MASDNLDLFVGNVELNASEDEVRQVFAGYGKITKCQSVPSKAEAATTKICFLGFQDPSAVPAILNSQKPFFLCGKRLKVNTAKPKPAKPSNSYTSGDKEKPSFRGGFGSQEPAEVAPVCLRKVQVLVTHVEHPCQFYGQTMAQEEVDRMAIITEFLQQHTGRLQPINGNLLPNVIYATKYSEDQQWYRCRVMKKPQNDMCEVSFVDYGNREQVSTGAILALPTDIATLAPMATKFALHGVRLKNENATSEEFVQGLAELQQKVLNVVVDLDIYSEGASDSRDSVAVVRAMVKSTDINEAMLQSHFVERVVLSAPQRADTFNRPQHVMDQGDGDRAKQGIGFGSQKEQQHFAGDGSLAGGRNRRESGGSVSSARDDEQRQFEGDGRGGRGFHRGSSRGGARGMGSSRGGGQQDSGRSQREPQSHWANDNRSMAQFGTGRHGFGGTASNETAGRRPQQSQMDILTVSSSPPRVFAAPHRSQPPAVSSSSSMHGPAPSVQSSSAHHQAPQPSAASLTSSPEFVRLRTKLELVKDELAAAKSKLAEPIVDIKIRNAIQGIAQIKALRRLFPTQEGLRDNIEWAMTIAASSSRLRLSHCIDTTSVDESTTAYDQAQAAIRTCKDFADREALVKRRDEKRKELHTAMTTSLQSLVKLPLDERERELQECLSQLRESHKAFLKSEQSHGVISIDDLDATITDYQAFKTAKAPIFAQMRQLTDAYQKIIVRDTLMLSEVLSLDLDIESNADYVNGFEGRLKNLTDAISSEVEATDLVKLAEGQYVTNVLLTVLRELEEELGDISSLRILRSTYRAAIDDIAPWLTARPDTADKLKAVRDSVRANKSELRHLLAFKQDLEDEGTRPDSVEMVRVDGELKKCRCKLHMAFIEEEKLVREATVVFEKHFPELLTYDIDLNSQPLLQPVKGLVRAGRSLEQYDVTRGEEDKPVIRTTFADRPVVLKSYVMTGDANVKEFFLKSVGEYHALRSDRLAPLEALFFDKGNLLAFLQVPQYGCSLGDIVNPGNALPVQDVLPIVHDLLSALVTLHQSAVIHGALHPNNVLIDSSGRAVLADYDLIKTPRQRGEKVYISAAGLRFQAPEINLEHFRNLNAAADMYNLGLLIVWMINPSAHDVNTLDISNDRLCAVVKQLLAKVPASRPASIDIFNDPLFAVPPSAEPREALTDDTPQTGDTCVDGRGCHSDTVTELQSDIVTSTAENAAKADDKANLTADDHIDTSDHSESSAVLVDGDKQGLSDNEFVMPPLEHDNNAADNTAADGSSMV